MTMKEFWAGVRRVLAVSAPLTLLLAALGHFITGKPFWPLYGIAVCEFARVFGCLYGAVFIRIWLDRVFGTKPADALTPRRDTSP